METREFCEQVKSKATFQEVARGFGLTDRGRRWGPCPACNAERTSDSDPRYPIGVSAMGGWKCWACQAEGDVVTLAAWKLCGADIGQLGGDGWSKIQSWATDQGFVSQKTSRRPYNPASRARNASGSSRGSGPSDEPEAPPEPQEAGGLFAWEDGLAEQCAAWMLPIFRDSFEGPDPDGYSAGDPAVKAVAAYLLEHRKIAEDVLTEAKIGLYVRDGKPVYYYGRPYLTIPLPDEHGKIVGLRFRMVPFSGACQDCDALGPFGECKACKHGDRETKRQSLRYRVASANPPRPSVLYGAHKLSADRTIPIKVQEGELDVLALQTYGFRENVVSGSAGAGTFRREWYDLLEPYDYHLIGFDPDKAGEEAAAKYIETMGADRCARTTFPGKDPGECLQAEIPVDQIRRALELAKPCIEIGFKRPGAYQEALEVLLNAPDKLRGVSTGSELMDSKFGGWRPGLHIFSGDTGRGKTTFLTWALWTLAKTDQRVAITSFEQQPIGSIQKLLRMQLGGDFTKVDRRVRAEAFYGLDQLPLHILDHYGHMSLEKVVTSIRYAYRRLGVRFVLVDHLGFLLGDDCDEKNERSRIEQSIRELAILANVLQISIFLVVHPRNTNQEQGKIGRVTMNHLKGASALRQDAHSVWIVDAEPAGMEYGRLLPKGRVRPWHQARLYCDKERSEFGAGGGTEVALAFDPISCRYADRWEDTPLGATGAQLPTPAGNDHRRGPSAKREKEKKTRVPKDAEDKQTKEEAESASQGPLPPAADRPRARPRAGARGAV